MLGPPRRHARRAAILVAVCASACGAAPTGTAVESAPLTLVVRCAPFPGVEAAAVAESSVRWNDADPADDDACTEPYAAVELKTLLQRCPGLRGRAIRFSTAATLPAGDVIVLGSPRSQPLVHPLMGAALPDLSAPDAFRIRTIPRDGRTIWVIAGSGRTGTLYGAYALLEQLGVRFYGPAPEETVWPRAPVTLPARLDLAASPAFAQRGFWAWEPRGNPAFFRWMARRRMNLWSAAEPNVALLRKLGIQLAGGGHTIQPDFLSPTARTADGRTRFQAHPEWYGLRAGKRSPNFVGAGDNFCTSNPAAMAELARNLVQSLRSGALRNADLVQVWPLDGGHWCECDACRALGNPADRELDLVAKLARAVREARQRGQIDRPVRLAAAAYLETMPPPTRPVTPESGMMVTFFPYYRCYAHALADPGCVEMNHRIEPAWEGWSQAPRRAWPGPIGVCEYYNVSWFRTLPLVYPHVMAADIRAQHDAGASSFCYMHAPTARWGSWRLNHLVLSEALWRPGLDVDSLIADYSARVCPDAPREMASYCRALETASANIFALELSTGSVFTIPGAPQGRLAVRSMPLFPYMHLPATAEPRPRNVAPAWSEIVAAMGEARAALDRARRAARAPDERLRLGADLRRFRYGECVFGLYDRLFRLARADRGEPGVDVARELAGADALARELHEVRDLVQVSGADANARDGLEASHVAPALAYFHQRFGNGGTAGK